MIGSVTARPNFKLQSNDSFISAQLLNNIISSTTVQTAVVEEKISELWYETLHGYGKVTFKNNITYEGSLKYGILNNEDPDNPCTLCFPDGTKYVGTIKNNRITGEGTYTFSNGSTYKGTVTNGLRDGFGIYKSADNIYYEGGWKNGLKDGKGKILQGGMELEGEWEKGVLCGKCRIKWKTGNIFEGELKDNAMNGNGYMIWFNKCEKFVGQWKNNLQNGFGVHIWYDKNNENKFFRNRYVGEWKNGKRNGYGKFFYNNGCVYEGFWKNNKKDGFGIYYYFDKTKYIGNFKDDIMLDKLTHEQVKLLINKNNANNNNNSPKDLLSKNQVFAQRLKSMASESIKALESNSNINNANISKEISKNLLSKNSVLSQGLKSMVSENIKKVEENANNINNNNPKESSKNVLLLTKGLKSMASESIKKVEANERKTTIRETTLKNEDRNFKDKKDRINKNIDQIKIPLFMSDLIDVDPDIKKYLKPLDNILLRNLSLITHVYLVACGKEDIKSSDIGMSTVLADGRSVFGKTNNIAQKPSGNIIEQKKIEEQPQWTQGQNEEKKEKEIDYDNVYNNDFYFCLDFKSLWKLIRDMGLISPDFSLAQVNRIIFQNKDNYIDMFYIPIYYENNNKNREQFEKIYDYVFKKIMKAKNDFNNRYKSQIDKFNKLTNEVIINIPDDENNKYQDIYEDDFNYHEEKNIILLRYFYEILIRIAYVKFSDEPDSNIESRTKILFDNLKTYFRSKKKSGSDLSTMNLCFFDPKLRNPEKILDDFITNHYIILQNLFNDLYLYSCDNENSIKNYDMTITYRYFYENIIIKNENFSKIFENKMYYIDLITLFFKERKITSLNIDTIDMSPNDLFEYIEKVLDCEMIFREFCELIFFISRKYFNFYGIIIEEEQEPKAKPRIELEYKKTKKSKKKLKKDDDENLPESINPENKAENGNGENEEKPKNEDMYLRVINEVEKTKNELIEKSKYEEANKYFYPILKNHTTIAKLMEEERLRKIEEEKREKDRIRYTKERMIFKGEDINIYKEEEEEEKTSEEISDY